MYHPGMTTTTSSPAALQGAAKLFRALSDEKRLRILDLLRGGEMCVCDLQDAMDAGQSLLSFHLKALREAGLVTDRREGRWAYYRLDPDAFALVAELAESARADAEQAGSVPCCATPRT